MSRSGFTVSRRLRDEAVAAAAAKFGVSPADINSRSRRADVIRSRHYAMWLLRQRLQADGVPVHSSTAIGAAFGFHHATALLAFRRFEGQAA